MFFFGNVRRDETIINRSNIITRFTGKVFYGWWVVLASTIICMFGYGVGLYTFGVFFKPMAAELGWSRALISIAPALRRIEGGFSSPFVGWATDKFGPRPVIFIGVLTMGLGLCLMYFVNSAVSFFLIYGVMVAFGMNLALYLPNQTAAAMWFKRRVSRAMSILTSGAAFGGAICAPLAAYLITGFGWRKSFLALGIIFMVIGLPLSLVIRRRPEDMGLRPDGDPPEDEYPDEADSDTVRPATQALEDDDYTLMEALNSRVFWILALSFFLQGMAHPTITVHTVNALTDSGIPFFEASFAFGFMILISVVGRLSFGWMGDFIKKRHLMIAAYFLQGVGILVLMNAQTITDAYLFTILYGIGFGGGVPLRPAIRAEYFGRKAFGKIGGFMSPVVMVGGISGPILAGYIFDRFGSYNGIFITIVVLQVLASVAMFFARPEKNS